MQTTSAPLTYAYPPVQTVYQPPTESEIYATKKQYLGLLPPLQVIEICLTFEAHAPLHVRSSVWPYDIRAAIAAIQASKARESQAQISDKETSTKLPGTEETSPGPQSEATLQPEATPQPSAQSVPSANLHYPHQPYYHPLYPHAPYYTPQATYGYSHNLPPCPPFQYPQGTPTQPPVFANASHMQGQHPAPVQLSPPSLNTCDDLPSYEEMIVAALLDCGDPEGCAPKELFSWMSMHYPLQTNFRPSASQALQKAYKRGRLEKGTNGRYRLNENWEGGNTSKRTTRRPQTLVQATGPGSQPPPPPSSPFTHRPLIPHTSQMRPYPSGQPSPGYPGFPCSLYHQGASLPPHPHLPIIGSTLPQPKQAADNTDHETGEGSDVWEAAQNILNAIYVGQLLRTADGDTAGGSGMRSADCNLANHHPAISTDATHDLVPPFTVVRETGDSGLPNVPDAQQRAALQAQLALLAVQLTELADVSGEDELSQDLCGMQGENQTSVSEPRGITEDEHEDMDLVEISVPTSSTHV